VTFEQLILQQRPHLERLVQEIARRYHLASTDVQEFRIALDQALERNNYELLRAFDGRSTWETYLRTVVTRQYYLYQTSLWGSWRPSERATRIGAAAVLLEELVLRDRFALPDAIDWMRTTHRVDEPRHKLMPASRRSFRSPSRCPTPNSAAPCARHSRSSRPRIVCCSNCDFAMANHSHG
jgi:hypothetical protein